MNRCCQTDPQVSIPILVCNMPQMAQEAYMKPYVPPPQYNPQIMPAVVYNINAPGNINNAGTYPNYFNNATVPVAAQPQMLQGQGMNNMMMTAPGQPMM
jgi:hypothetical protein